MSRKDTKLSIIPFFVLIGIAILALIFDSSPDSAKIDANSKAYVYSDIAWMLVASAMVLIMTPGLALFYGGMVNAKNLISTMLQSFICMGIISVLWIVVGYSLAFGESIKIGDYGIIGNPFTHFMFRGVIDGAPWKLAPTIPLILFAFFQLKFAVITPALITGSFSMRIRFTSYILFACLFSMLIYAPLAHMTWHPEGLLLKLGVLDFAGGTVVHISAGCAALAGAIYLGRRREKTEMVPANIPYILIGTGLLWFGWFGFNAGSYLSTGLVTVSAFAATNTAAAAAGMAWILYDAVRGKKPSAMGFCIGVVVGLVAITPAAGFVTISAAIFIGVAASLISNMVVHLMGRINIDDTLDVFPCHGLGGITGMLFTGIFANGAVNSVVVADGALGEGLFYGKTALFLMHLVALVLVIVFSFGGSYLLLMLTNLITPLRVSVKEEKEGLDSSQHGENIYEATVNADDRILDLRV
jgi:Amt family ammonium transporter